MAENLTIYEYTKGFNETEGSEKTLFERTAGKFYTPDFIGDNLIAKIPSVNLLCANNLIKIIDPFCGDGRLILKFLKRNKQELAAVKCQIHIWDVDAQALKNAKSVISHFAEKNDFNIELIAVLHNSFTAFKEKREGFFDLCLTNPPWETIKPDKRELKHLSTSQIEIYTKELKKLDALLSNKYPLSQPNIKFSGWGTNLARVGVELSARLLRDGGVCGIISPSTLFADKQSFKLRKWLMTEFTVDLIQFYKAETKLFSRVDQETSAVIFAKTPKKEKRTRISYFDKDLVEQNFGEISFNLKNLQKANFRLPNYYGLKAKDILLAIKNFDSLGEYSNNLLWSGRELDETRDKKLLTKDGVIPFYKGRMIQRFSICEEPFLFIAAEKEYVLPKSRNYYRIAWRDVSRPNQRRRMIATILPPKTITGNSLGVLYFLDNDLKKLKALLVILNSLIFELQVRSFLSTSHMSVGAVRMGKIPDLENNSLVNSLSRYADLLMNNYNVQDELKAEEIVFAAYGVPTANINRLINLFKNGNS